MTQIHPSAIVDSQAELAEDVVVGPFCLVGPKGVHRRGYGPAQPCCGGGLHYDRRTQCDLRGSEYWLPSAGQKVPRRGYASGGG